MSTTQASSDLDLDNDSRVKSLYSSLPLAPERRCIRILQIKEAPDDNPDGPLEAELRVIDLDESPDFSVLSYVWGIDGTQRIKCGDAYVQITKNGYAALIALRKQLESLAIWVDAVCIDQSNTQEKQYQIPLMGDIYARATTAYIWLGDETASSARVVKYLKGSGLLEHIASLDVPAKMIPRRVMFAALWAIYSPFRRGSRDPLPIIGG